MTRAVHINRDRLWTSLEAGFSTGEEGTRFGADMLGSAVSAGRIPLDQP